MVNILFIGDIIGRPGREAIKKLLPQIKAEQKIDFVIANGENAAGGNGITPEVANDLINSGIDVITGGNHTWANREILKIIDSEPRLLRPANFPENVGVPGRGVGIYNLGEKFKIAVINLIGRVFMKSYDCPFRTARKILNNIHQQTRLIVVDMHAEATSEKAALGWFLEGEVTAVIGTHTHIQTADERILPGGTAYITDVGMTGPFDSVIGVKKDVIIDSFIKVLPVRHTVASDDVRFCAVVISAEPVTGKALAIKRLNIPV